MNFRLYGCWAAAGLLVIASGCEPPKVASKAAGGPPPPPGAPAPPPPPAQAGVGVITTQVAADSPGTNEPVESTAVEPPRETAASSITSLLPALSSDETQIRRMFAEAMDLSRATDGKAILARTPPERRSATIISMASMAYLMLGPSSEAGQMVTESGLLADKYQPMFDDLKDKKIDTPANQALLDEAAGKIRDPERLLTLVMTSIVPRMPEAKFELVNLTVEGDRAAGVTLVVTHFGTQPNPFAAEKIDGAWRVAEPTPAAEAKVQEYEANPTPATVKLPPRDQLHVTAEELSREFQTNPSGAAQKYGSPFGGSTGQFAGGPPGRFGGPPGPSAGPPGPFVMPLPPAPPSFDILLEGTVAFHYFIARDPVLYLVTPGGSPAVNLMVVDDAKLAKLLAAAQPGQKVEVLATSVVMMTPPMGGQGTITVSGRQIKISGEPSEPHGPLLVAEFLAEISDPATAAKNQARPIIVQGPAVASVPQIMHLTLADDQGRRVSCLLNDSEQKKLRAIKQGQTVRVQGTYVPPVGNNQLMLRGCVLVAGDAPPAAPR